MVDTKNNFYKFLSVEDTHHVEVVEFVKIHLPLVLCFHVPSEGRKSAFECYKHSIMGNVKGLPDFIFLHPKYKLIADATPPYRELISHALLIELKAPEHIRTVQKGKRAGKQVKAKGKLSDEQADIIERMNKLRYKAYCCFGANKAIEVIKGYFNLQ